MTNEAAAKTRVLLADDEPLGRARLRMLLAEEARIEIVAECADAPTTVAAIEKLRPDLVFLDIQMPGGSGFDVIETIGADRMPFVIFVTAFDRYALRAFEVHALDYLLKPFDRDRFRDAVARARARIDHNPQVDLERRLLALGNDLKPGPQPLERLVIKSGGRVFFLRAADIEWIEAAGNYVKLHVGADTHIFRETMNALEARLDSSVFFRIHRSHIVNIERVRELQPWFNGEYVVFLTSGARLTLSRGYRDKLQDRIGRPL
jgi:two-component system, LytTR family, response regulator